MPSPVANWIRRAWAGSRPLDPDLDVAVARVRRPVGCGRGSVGATENAAEIVDAAAAIARDAGHPLEVVHVRETAVVEELAIDAEDADQAHSAVLGHLDRLAAQGIAATGQVLTSVGDHAAAGRVLAQHADEIDARMIAIGPSPRGPVAQFADGSFTTAVTHTAARTVVLVGPGKKPHRLTA